MILQIMDVKKQEDEVSLGTSVAFLNDNGDCGLCYVRPKNLRRSTQVFTNMNMDALSFFIHAYIILFLFSIFLCFSFLCFIKVFIIVTSYALVMHRGILQTTGYLKKRRCSPGSERSR